jgi:hypothetical protein
MTNSTYKSINDCIKGDHSLQDITSSTNLSDDVVQVVRWCNICGSIVVDEELDERVYPGKAMPMMACKLYHDAAIAATQPTHDCNGE